MVESGGSQQDGCKRSSKLRHNLPSTCPTMPPPQLFKSFRNTTQFVTAAAASATNGTFAQHQFLVSSTNNHYLLAAAAGAVAHMSCEDTPLQSLLLQVDRHRATKFPRTVSVRAQQLPYTIAHRKKKMLLTHFP